MAAIKMTMPGSILLAALFAGGAAQAQVDTDAAKGLAKKNGCLKCHAVDKVKNGPSYHEVATKMKDKPDGVERVIRHITTGPRVKLEDGREEEHKIIETSDPKELDNLARWILSL